jgi:signal transduction histidine kinase
LHESAAQSLAAISWQLGALAREGADSDWERRVTSVKELAEQVLEEVRILAQTLHPGVLDNLGLAAALTQLARQARDDSGINVAADVDPDASRNLHPAVAAALYHVAQEAVANALYHGDPRTITVRLLRSADLTVLEVRDDGNGFDVPGHERRSGSGIFSMRERVGLVDAHLDIESAIGDGTTVRASLRNERVRMEKTA